MHLFYPSHDIALAHGVKHFNPPAAALRLQEDLAYLYEIWNQPFMKGETTIPIPWGWDWDTRNYIHQKYDVKMSLLPSDEDLELIRQLSSRKSSITCFEQLGNKLFSDLQDSKEQQEIKRFIGGTLPEYLDTEEKLWNFITEHDEVGKLFVLKTPWSSSGRGLHVSISKTNTGLTVNNSRTIMMKQALGTIKKMGGIMGEEWITGKERDFAMLFYASDQNVRFIGYSLFDNDNNSIGTTYRQGYLLSNENIINRLSVPEDLLSQIAKSYEEILTEMLCPFFDKSWQLGYLGIDMMTYHEGEKNDSEQPLKINPCVELNLRCTMGVVCRLWYDKHLTEGIFRISPMLYNRHFKAEFLPTA